MTQSSFYLSSWKEAPPCSFQLEGLSLARSCTVIASAGSQEGEGIKFDGKWLQMCSQSSAGSLGSPPRPALAGEAQSPFPPWQASLGFASNPSGDPGSCPASGGSSPWGEQAGRLGRTKMPGCLPVASLRGPRAIPCPQCRGRDAPWPARAAPFACPFCRPHVSLGELAAPAGGLSQAVHAEARRVLHRQPGCQRPEHDSDALPLGHPVLLCAQVARGCGSAWADRAGRGFQTLFGNVDFQGLVWGPRKAAGWQRGATAPQASGCLAGPHPTRCGHCCCSQCLWRGHLGTKLGVSWCTCVFGDVRQLPQDQGKGWA